MKELFKLTGRILVETRKKDGTVIAREEKKNLIVTSGKNKVADLIGVISTGVQGFTHMAIGESITGDVVDVADVALETEVKRVAPTISQLNNQVIFEHTFSFDTGEAFGIKEAGIFDSITPIGSIMLNRVIFSEKNVDVDTDLYVKFTITVS
jgi:hypothetical protein